MTGDGYATLIGSKITADDLHGRGLAGAIGPEKAQHFALADAEAQILYRLDVAVGTRNVFDVDEYFGTFRGGRWQFRRLIKHAGQLKAGTVGLSTTHQVRLHHGDLTWFRCVSLHP
jgi:hypothetical protein